MSTLTDRLVRLAFVLGVVGALTFGVQSVVAAGRALQCPCDPLDPGADDWCVECCVAELSVCPWGGTGERECLCA
jgi:hypothetical protein